MHTSSLEHVQRLVDHYLTECQELEVIDIGSCDVNGSYKAFFSRPGWGYTGVDLAPGPNVDVVLNSPYKLPFASHSVDVVVSGQAFEHVEFFWLTWLEMTRILRPGGYIFLVAPSRGPEHRYPQDCWRFYPDGFRALGQYGDLEILETTTDWTPHAAEDSAAWGDTVGVFRQRPMSKLKQWRRVFMQRLRHWLLPGYR
ncbi:class I SAM-dependent methyltransferase [Acidovorax sp.]|uniref:methyltransferase domain-containing protein n=1 Tax=Acidovorax sp. TaxID=1872122 RepID=UPI001AD09D58|nr:class I SAM-dependent methyltransferase [Acidovorax sp.]MBN9627290.1 class I SAM-dependent methyltransferase [Acidovorax sp.]